MEDSKLTDDGTLLEASSEDKIYLYDFASYDSIMRDHLPGLERIFESMATSLWHAISKNLNTLPNIYVSSIEYLRYGEFMNLVPVPTPIIAFSNSALKDQVLFFTDTDVMYKIISHSLGADGGPKITGKNILDLEFNIYRSVVKEFINEGLDNAFGSIFDGSRFKEEYSTQRYTELNYCNPHDIVVALNIDIEFQKEKAGRFSFVFTYESLLKHKMKLWTPEPLRRSKSAIRNTNGLIAESSANVSLTTLPLEITLRELRKLQVGDLVLELSADDNVNLEINGEFVKQTKLKG